MTTPETETNAGDDGATAYFNAELRRRLALRLGLALMDGEAANLQAEMNERRLQAANGRLEEIEAQVAKLDELANAARDAAVVAEAELARLLARPKPATRRRRR